MKISSIMSAGTLRITLLADEWNSSKGGLSTMNRELAIQLAKHPNVAVTFFVPKCSEVDKKAACSRNISIVEAIERYGYNEVDWLSFPPRDLVIDTVIGHGVMLGKQAQVIRESHHCTWMQVVHTAPEKLAMFKTYSGAISKGDGKQWTEVNLCTIADLVVAVGPKLYEFYSRYLSRSGKNVFNLTPGIFTEFSDLKPSTQGTKEFWVLVFGRGDSEDFELKGFDIAAKAVAELNDRSYQLIFVGAPSGNETQVVKKLLKQGLTRRQLTVKGFIENREDLATLLSTANLAVIPSRTEGFGLTALEALSAGLPFLVTQNSGFGEALQEIPFSSSWIVDSEDPKKWAEAIKGVREKGRETALEECKELRTRYAEKYSWEKQCNDIVEMLLAFFNASDVESAVVAPSQNRSQATSINENADKDMDEEHSLGTSKGERRQAVSNESPDHFTGVLKDNLEMPQPGSATETEGKMVDCNEDQSVTGRRSEDSSISDIHTVTAKTATSNSDQGARPKEILPSNTERTKLKGPYVGATPESTFSKRFTLKAKAKDTPSREKVAILCRDQSDITIVRDLFGDELFGHVHIFSGPPDAGPKSLLPIISMRYCIIVVDARTMKDELCYKSAGTPCTDLLNAARATVERKVVIIICSDGSEMSQNEEDALTRSVKLLLGEKGEILWWKRNRNSLHQTQNAKRSCQYRRSQFLPEYDGIAERSQIGIDRRPTNPNECTLLLKTRLRYGRISYRDEDVNKTTEGWKPPKELEANLMKKWRSTADAELLIYQEHKTGRYRVVVNEESLITQAVTSNESAEVGVKAKTPINYSNVEPVKVNESVERQKAETKRRQENVLVHQLLNSEKSNLVEPVQVTPESTSGPYAEATPGSTCNKRLKAKDTPSLEKKVAILCRDQSDVTIIRDVFGDELLGVVHIFSAPPDAGPKSLLSIDSMRSCITVVDARTMKDELCYKLAGTPYKDLLNTARKTVERKVVIIICSDGSEMSQNEEDALTRSVKLLLGEKGEILWWKRNRNSLHQTQNAKRSCQYRRSQSLPEYDGMAL